MPEYKTIRYEVKDGLLTVTLNRPEQLNAYTYTMMDELIDAFDRSDRDDDVRVVLVTGAGRAFCAGADVSAGGDSFKRNEGVFEPKRDGGGQVSLRIYQSLKPVIGVVNGAAVGFGLTMTLPMDIRLASETARFGCVFVRRGIVPEAASTWFLPRLVGPSRAAEFMYTGRLFGAREALDSGLVRSIHPPDELMAAAVAIGREIADFASPVSVALTRQMLWRGQAFDEPYAAHVAESRALGAVQTGPDAREGITAFLQKRPAAFPGKVSENLPDVFSDPQPTWAADLPWAAPPDAARP
jgi:enoyl-CoA hydratase/carnithine racemase